MFNLLRYAFGCTGGRLSPAERAQRMEPRGIDVAERCAYFIARMKNRANRVTRVPLSGSRREDLIVRFIWARYIDELSAQGALAAMLDADACDLYVLSVGFWQLRMPRSMEDVRNASAQLGGMLASLGWDTPGRAGRARRDLLRSRLAWRSASLIEVSLGLFANRHITRLNQRMDGTLRSRHIPVYNFEALFEGINGTHRERKGGVLQGLVYTAVRGGGGVVVEGFVGGGGGGGGGWGGGGGGGSLPSPRRHMRRLSSPPARALSPRPRRPPPPPPPPPPHPHTLRMATTRQAPCSWPCSRACSRMWPRGSARAGSQATRRLWLRRAVGVRAPPTSSRRRPAQPLADRRAAGRRG